MKKFAIVTIGFTPPSPEFMQEWMAWFESIKSQTVQQFGFKNGIEVNKKGKQEIPMDLEAMTGMLIVEAEDREAALKMAEAGPMVSSTRIYEVW